MDIYDEREPGECSRTPSPVSEVAHVNVKKAPIRRTHRYENTKFRKDAIELVDLVEEDNDGDIEIIQMSVKAGSSDDDLFVLDTEGSRIVEVEEVNKKNLTVTATPGHGLEKEERKVLLKTARIRGKDNVFDVTKILTNDAALPSPSEEKKESTFKISCFNCAGEHTLQQCDIPLNQRRIAANRAAHFNNKRSTQERYTTASNTETAGTCNMRPGEISNTLREALGIGPNDIPEWIYRMRRRGFIDGYPPGYLSEALDQSSGEESLLEFHTDDKTLESPHIMREKDKWKRLTVSADKVIAYPGFNYCNRYLRDRERFRVPRFDEYIRYLREYVKERHPQRLLDGRNRKRGKYTDEHLSDRKRSKKDSDDSLILVGDEPKESVAKSTRSLEDTVLEKNVEHNTSIVGLETSMSYAEAGSQSVNSNDHRISFGTPVVCRLEHDKRKPSLEKFRDGIVPFEAVEESTGNRGFFRTLMLKIRKKNEEPSDDTAHISAPTDHAKRSVEVDIDVSAFLVDETSSDDSDEIAVFDSRDLSLLNNERKALCEERICNLYKTFRYNGPEYKTRRTVYGFATLDTEFFDHIQEKITLDYDEEKISKAITAFHIDKMGIREGAAKMEISVFNFIVLLMDHIWKERDKTIDNYSISRVAGYLGVDRAHMFILGNLINSNVVLAPSEIAIKTLSEPIELIVMLTMLLAQMYGWSVAKDFNQNWKNIETSSIPSDEEAMQSMDDFVTIAREVLEDFRNDRSSPLCRHVNDGCGSDLVIISNKLTQYASNLLNELVEFFLKFYDDSNDNHDKSGYRDECFTLIMRNFSSSNESVPQASVLTRDWINQAEMLTKEQRENLTEKSMLDSQKNVQTFSAMANEEISVVDVTHSENIQKNYVIINDPVNISDIPNGSFCLARQQKAYNFVRCQIVEKVSPREYNVLFGDGNEEIIDISRIALKVEGRLHMWEGVRVCALYEPKLQFGRYRKAFYSGIVGVGPHGFSQNEMLVFFDNGIDSFVHERTVYILAEQKCRLQNCKEEIDRRNNWCLVPQFRQKFVKHYLKNFPDWPLVSMKRKENTQRVNILREGKPHSAYVLRTERQFALLRFPIRNRCGADCVVTPCNRHIHIDEWIYRGSERLEAIRQTIDRLEKIEQQEKTGVLAAPLRSRREARLAHNLEYTLPLPGQSISNMNSSKEMNLCPRGRALLSDNEPNYPRRQTARKGGILAVQHEIDYQDCSIIEGRVLRLRKERNLTVQDIPEWNNLQQMVHLQCSVRCLQHLDKDPYDKEFCGYSPYMIPLLVGWSREIVTFTRKAKVAHSRKAISSAVVYRTPCGISIYRLDQISKYLKDTYSRLTIDLFTFDRTIRPNVIYRTPVEAKLMDDFTNGYEAIPISVYNEIDDELPPKIEYNPRRYPYDKETDVSSISRDFCSGCTCTDDCADETRCECRLLTRSEVLRLDKSLQPSYAKGYMYRNLALGGTDESYLSGLYECNDKCGCSRSNCHNRVVQQQMKIPLELFKTEKMGWGVRSMIDIPAGVFLCTYAGAILTDSQAEKEGKTFGDEYFADVNLVDNVEKEKHNAGVDLGDSNDGYYSDEENNCGGGSNLSVESELITVDDDACEEEDEDYDSGQDSSLSSEGNHSESKAVKMQKRRKLVRENNEKQRDSSTRESEKSELAAADLDYARSSLVMVESDVFTGGTKSDSDDMPAVEPAGPPEGRFDMVKYVESMKLPSLYTIDAKKKGNIGRFFNHSCQPNIRTQLVYVDTHDFRLPWIAFFTTTKISAGSELFWDYGYSEGAVDGKQLECFCGSRFCRKRLL
ncbi:unnamed protein product [Cercopithifilaria johnstoni]|uniref:Uncharacterized protein n=1 Tax=Cercopithifilaria johnstoni TaxID=2874296 RepID=A0A8J2M732_9BILA|nr:unnamed protein product [Cercopithifilaria johnstoni]